MGFFSFLIYASIGTVAGFFSGLLGIGGGIIIVPCLVFFFHFLGFPHHYVMQLALGTSLASMILTTTTATIFHHKARRISWPILTWLIPGLILGSILGSGIVDLLPGEILKFVFAIFILGISVFVFIFKKNKRTIQQQLFPETSKNHKKWIYPVGGLCIGFLGSLFGVSGGIFSIPFLLSRGFKEKEAVACSSAISCFAIFLSSFFYFYFGSNEPIELKGTLGYIYLPAFYIIALSSFLFAWLGGYVAGKTSDHYLRYIFSVLLVVVAIFMVFNPI